MTQKASMSSLFFANAEVCSCSHFTDEIAATSTRSMRPGAAQTQFILHNRILMTGKRMSAEGQLERSGMQLCDYKMPSARKLAVEFFDSSWF